MDERKQDTARIPDAQTPAPETGDTQWQPLEMPEEMRETCLYSLFDVAAAETWLEDRAREGWRFRETRSWKAVFDRAEPQACRYRLQPLGKKKETISPERREVYESLGWQYVTVMQGLFHVWRCEDPIAPELDTDPVVQAEGYRYLKRRMLRSALVELGFLVLLTGMLIWQWTSEAPLLYTLEELPGRMLLRQVWLWLILVLEARELLGMRRVLRTLRAGVPLSRPRPYRLQQWLQRAAVAMAFLVLVVYPFMDMGYSFTDQFHGWDVLDKSGVPKAEAVYWELSETEDLVEEPIYWEAETKIHELASRMYYVREYGDLEDDLLAAAITTYYGMRTEGLGRQLAGEVREEFASRGGREALVQHTADGLDEFWWSREIEPEAGFVDVAGGLQYVVARKGGQVIAVEYRGRTDLRTQTDYLVELLEP